MSSKRFTLRAFTNTKLRYSTMGFMRRTVHAVSRMFAPHLFEDRLSDGRAERAGVQVTPLSPLGQFPYHSLHLHRFADSLRPGKAISILVSFGHGVKFIELILVLCPVVDGRGAPRHIRATRATPVSLPGGGKNA